MPTAPRDQKPFLLTPGCISPPARLSHLSLSLPSGQLRAGCPQLSHRKPLLSCPGQRQHYQQAGLMRQLRRLIIISEESLATIAKTCGSTTDGVTNEAQALDLKSGKDLKRVAPAIAMLLVVLSRQLRQPGPDQDILIALTALPAARIILVATL